ncbi:MAG: hypothetical protein ABWY11_10315 [Umezawaea sp.]
MDWTFGAGRADQCSIHLLELLGGTLVDRRFDLQLGDPTPGEVDSAFSV